jgi:hypothetical protein
MQASTIAALYLVEPVFLEGKVMRKGAAGFRGVRE